MDRRSFLAGLAATPLANQLPQLFDGETEPNSVEPLAPAGRQPEVNESAYQPGSLEVHRLAHLVAWYDGPQTSTLAGKWTVYDSEGFDGLTAKPGPYTVHAQFQVSPTEPRIEINHPSLFQYTYMMQPFDSRELWVARSWMWQGGDIGDFTITGGTVSGASLNVVQEPIYRAVRAEDVLGQ